MHAGTAREIQLQVMRNLLKIIRHFITSWVQVLEQIKP